MINSYENKANLVPINSLSKVWAGYKVDDETVIKETNPLLQWSRFCYRWWIRLIWTFINHFKSYPIDLYSDVTLFSFKPFVGFDFVFTL